MLIAEPSTALLPPAGIVAGKEEVRDWPGHSQPAGSVPTALGAPENTFTGTAGLVTSRIEIWTAFESAPSPAPGLSTMSVWARLSTPTADPLLVSCTVPVTAWPGASPA